ncbi:MAG TPA: ribose-5-phosphate isomerase A [Gemmatimonadaceae bacterium]|nr:ribose-5-phosphate isomerase A [Gemmatimonadaceae bacterium]
MSDGKAARKLERELLAIAGVVDTGLFLGTADSIIVGHVDGHTDTYGRVGGENIQVRTGEVDYYW